MFRKGQVVKFVRFGCDVFAQDQGWRINDLAYIDEIDYGSTLDICVRRVRDHYSAWYNSRGFDALTFQPNDRVRIVGFGPNGWMYKWENRTEFLDEIGTEGIVIEVRHRIYVDASLRMNRDCSRDNAHCMLRTWRFDPRQTIPELIPYQSDEEFDANFWRNLYLSHPNVVAVEGRGVDPAEILVPPMYVTNMPVISLEPEPDLPEPKKTKYDADY